MDRKIKNLKTTLVITRVAMVVGVLTLIYCGFDISRLKSSMDKCSSVISGVVTDVERKNDTRHGFYYKAYVTSEDDPGMTFETPFTKHKYEKGDSVKIHYDPDDMSDYYIDGAEPTGETVSLIVAVVFMLIVVSVTHIVRGKQYRQLCSQQSGSPF